MPSEPTMIRCPHCRLDFTEGGYKAHRESEFSGCDEPEPACVRCGAPVTLLFCDECMDVVGAEIKRGEEIVKDVFPTPPEPACDFDPLAVNANWDDSTDIACKVASAAMAYARRTPDAVERDPFMRDALAEAREKLSHAVDLATAAYGETAKSQGFIDSAVEFIREARALLAAERGAMTTTTQENSMNIEDMTIGQARQIASLFGTQQAQACPFQIGEAYLIRTVTMTWTGRVREIVGGFLVLDSAAWIADTGRFHLAVDADALVEVEPVGDGVFVGLGAVVDSRPWDADLPARAK